MNVALDHNELVRLRGTLSARALDELRDARLLERAADALAMQDAPRALSLAQAALLLDADDARALYFTGMACLRLGRRDQAKAAFERALLEEPHYWASAVELAKLHAEAGDCATARGYLALLTGEADVPPDVLHAVAECAAT